MALATLTSKGQITIPVSIRNRLGLKPGDQIDFVPGPDGRVSLEPKRTPFEALQGILRVPGQKPVSQRAMDRGIREAAAARFRRATRPAMK
jgi:antitoxin PrlF